MIPKFSAPLTKSIRTLEGVLVVAANVALAVIPIATTALTAGQAAKYATILNVAFVFSRSLLKGLATFTAQTGITPSVSDKTVAVITSDVTEAAGAGLVLERQLESAVKAGPQAPEPAPVPVIAPQMTAPAGVTVSFGQAGAAGPTG